MCSMSCHVTHMMVIIIIMERVIVDIKTFYSYISFIALWFCMKQGNVLYINFFFCQRSVMWYWLLLWQRALISQAHLPLINLVSYHIQLFWQVIVAQKDLGVLRSIPRHKVRLFDIMWASSHRCAKKCIMLPDIFSNIVAVTK